MVHHSGRLHPPAVLIFSREFVSNLTAKEGWGKGAGRGRGPINFLSFAFLLLNNVLIVLSLSPSLILSLLQCITARGPHSVTDEFVRGTRQLLLPRTRLGELNVTLAPAPSDTSHRPDDTSSWQGTLRSLPKQVLRHPSL